MPSAAFVESDCVEFLRTLPDNSVDLALYDPPYFMGKKPFINKEKKYARMVADWDNQWKTLDGYLEWCRPWLAETHRILRPGGTILVFGSTHSVFDLHVLMRRLSPGDDDAPYFTFRNFVTWHVTNAPPIFLAKNEGIYARSSQYFNYFTKGKRAAYFNYDYLKALNGGVQQRDWFDLPQAKLRERVGHPSQKPQDFMEILVEAHCPPDGMVVDCFLGSGTTAVASARKRRNFAGCDLSLEYVTMSERRTIKQLVEDQFSVKRIQSSGSGDPYAVSVSYEPTEYTLV